MIINVLTNASWIFGGWVAFNLAAMPLVRRARISHAAGSHRVE